MAYPPEKQKAVRQEKLEAWEALGREFREHLSQMSMYEVELMFGETIASIVKRMRQL